jgi:hypothetical protein
MHNQLQLQEIMYLYRQLDEYLTDLKKKIVLEQ